MKVKIVKGIVYYLFIYFAAKFYELYIKCRNFCINWIIKIFILCKNLKYRIHCEINRTTDNSRVLLPQVQRWTTVSNKTTVYNDRNTMSGFRILVGCKRVIDYAVKVSVISYSLTLCTICKHKRVRWYFYFIPKFLKFNCVHFYLRKFLTFIKLTFWVLLL